MKQTVYPFILSIENGEALVANAKWYSVLVVPGEGGSGLENWFCHKSSHKIQ